MNRRFALLVAIFVAIFMAQTARAEGPVTIVDNPAVLAALDAKGFDFAGIFGVDGKGDLKTLYDKAQAYRAIVETVAGDVAALRTEMKAGGRPLYEVTDGNVGRIMDMRWLKTDAARFRLVGVVNRLDRRDFTEIRGDGRCGEVRFIYRLAYSFKKNGKVLASPAVQFQRRLQRRAGRRWRLRWRCRALDATDRRDRRCRLALRRAAGKSRAGLQAA